MIAPVLAGSAPRPKRVRLMVVDDSLLFRGLVTKGFEGDDSIEVIGTAADPYEAKDKLPVLRPDVLLLDVEMPRMDGIKFLKSLMAQSPLPVIVVSSLAVGVFETLDAGALDFIGKMASQDEYAQFMRTLKDKVIAASNAKFAYRRQAADPISLSPLGIEGQVDRRVLVAIGASTGGTDAILSILSKFSANMPGMVVTQHMPPGFTELFAKRLDSMCHVEVREAKDGDMVVPGVVLVAPGDRHLTVSRAPGGYRASLVHGERVNGHMPSVDVMFESVARAAGPDAVGVILTGMGVDGAAGLRLIRDAGGSTIGQDERSSVVYGMPMAAFMMGGVGEQLPLYRIADALVRVVS